MRRRSSRTYPFSGSPLSGILWGGIGTTLSPYLQFNDDISVISAALDGADPDYTTAFDHLLNMPANLTNATGTETSASTRC